jgi:hypothetical protein
MPTKEINAAIEVLEAQLKAYEKSLDASITNNEIFSKTKVILLELRKVSKKLDELKKLKADNN